MNTYWTDSLARGKPHSLLISQFELRKRLFVDRMQWKLPIKGQIEADQYDTPHAVYCLTEHNGKLAASARIVPTTTDLGTSTYMILDAALGRLRPTLPPELCHDFSPPVSEKIWEATRLTVCPSLPKDEKRRALRCTIDRMMKEAFARGITEFIAIGGIDLALGVRTAGYQVLRLTPFHDLDGTRVAIYRLPVIHL